MKSLKEIQAQADLLQAQLQRVLSVLHNPQLVQVLSADTIYQYDQERLQLNSQLEILRWVTTA